MNNYISFKPGDAILSTYIRFSITNKAFEDMRSLALDPIEELIAFSKSKTLIVTKTNNDWYKVFTDNGSYLCKMNDDGFLITGFIENTLLDHNQAMKNGTLFTANEGIIVQIKLKSYGIFQEIVHGREYTRNQYENVNVSDAIKTIVEQLDENEDQKRNEESEVKVSKKLLRLLKTAESYAILSSEKEEKEANEQGNIPYTYIKSVDYHRIDRVAYEFGVQGLDEKIFKVGTQVEIEDIDQERHSAEITTLIREDEESPIKGIVLLFNQHISMEDFYQMGWFHLSFSTVNKDVQLAANEKIRTGEAQAKYMDNVLGKGTSEGFEKKDLSQVEEKLNQEEYPPNPSQMNAIKGGIESKDVYLVMGPPGTGKTTVIVEWAKYFIEKEQKRVLISSQNNKAVDNVMTRLAEEKSMDMIRVGSESKLQSDVIPYLFENKVAQLRETISKETKTNSDVIQKILAQWTPYGKKVHALEKSALFMEKKREEFASSVNEKLKPLYEKLITIEEENETLQEEKIKNVEKINTLHNKIEKHEAKPNGFLKTLTTLFYRRNIKEIKKKVHDFTLLKEEESKIQENYHQIKGSYDEEYNRILDYDFHFFYEAKHKTEKDVLALKEKPEKIAGNIWGLFDQANAMEITTLSHGLAQKDHVEKAFRQGHQLLEILSSFRDETLSKQNYALDEIVLESVDLVGATCIGINSQKRFADLTFDVTIMDEAGQIQIHNALVPMSVSNKLIMLGDYMQIPPMADPELVEICEANGVNADLLKKSLFEYMYEEGPKDNKIMLDTQYRMPSEIADTLSEYFYGGNYYSPGFKESLAGELPWLSENPFILIDTSKERNRFEEKSDGGGYDNLLEALIVEKIMTRVSSDAELNLKEVGIISAYRAQVKLMKNQLSNTIAKETLKDMVASLDSFQGQERDIIIYSFTRSSTKSPHQVRIGFLNELRRLNVAMSRCKKTLILIGDLEFLKSCQHVGIDEDEEEIYEGSERQFSEFIVKMTKDVKNGRGEKISVKEFNQRVMRRE